MVALNTSSDGTFEFEVGLAVSVSGSGADLFLEAEAFEVGFSILRYLPGRRTLDSRYPVSDFLTRLCLFIHELAVRSNLSPPRPIAPYKGRATGVSVKFRHGEKCDLDSTQFST